MRIVFILILLPVLGFAQIPPNAKTIIAKNVSFLQVCNALLDHGFTIEKKDNDLMTATTDPMQFPKYWNASLVVSKSKGFYSLF